MHGGKRIGAGRKKGVQNTVNALVRERALASGESPLEYLLRIMRDPTQDGSIRLETAKAAAPYLHPRLQAVEHADHPDRPLQQTLMVRFVSANRDRREP